MTAWSIGLGYNLPSRYDDTRLPTIAPTRPADPYLTGYVVPVPVAEPAHEVIRKLHDLIRWTGWSNRQLATVIGSSHPTIANALQGDTTALSRSANQRQRLDEAYDVVLRVYLLTNRNPRRTAEVLDTPTTGDVTATEHLEIGEPVKAYLTALRVLRPPRQRGMMRGQHPIDPRTATAAVLDQD